MPKTGTKLQEVFDKHLAYEIDRLAAIYALLAGPDTFGFSSLSKDIQDTMKDALIVAFCIHAKNLIEFLTRKPEHHHAASADYTIPATTVGRLSTEVPRTHSGVSSITNLAI